MKIFRSNGYHKVELIVTPREFIMRQNGNTVKMRMKDMDKFWDASCDEWDDYMENRSVA